MSEFVPIASRQYSWGNCNKDVTQHRIETLVQPNALFSRVLLVAERGEKREKNLFQVRTSAKCVYIYPSIRIVCHARGCMARFIRETLTFTLFSEAIFCLQTVQSDAYRVSD